MGNADSTVHRPPENRLARTIRSPIRRVVERHLESAQLKWASEWLRDMMKPGEEPFAVTFDRHRNGHVWIVTNQAIHLVPKPTRANRRRDAAGQRIPHTSVARIDEIHDHRGISRVLTATYEGDPFLFSGRFHRREDPTLVRSLSKLTGVQVETEIRGLARGSTN